jgi:hypothetical protein
MSIFGSKSGLPVEHVDLNHRKKRETNQVADYNKALSNLRLFRDLSDTDARSFSQRLAHVLNSERDRRNGHYMMYKLMTRVAMNEPLFMDDSNLPEVSLLDLDKRTSALTPEEIARAKIYNTTGISAELGHVDQLGDWNAAKPLDDAIRALPESAVLDDAGFVFGETYASKDAAMISYRFNIVDGVTEPVLKATRRRAAADIITEAESEYEVVKLSSFLVNDDLLSGEAKKSIQDVMRYGGKKDKDSAAASQHAGELVIEPYIVNREIRSERVDVLAATSLYFALKRH